ncbi:MAG: hypothetical protein WCH77_13705, partial [Planctomycetota bacterium]
MSKLILNKNQLLDLIKSVRNVIYAQKLDPDEEQLVSIYSLNKPILDTNTSLDIPRLRRYYRIGPHIQEGFYYVY